MVTHSRSKSKQKERILLTTLTKEPFQPVRIYYSIPSKLFVVKKLKKLKCMVEVPREQCWQWLFHAESSKLHFFGGYDDVPVERRPIVLGRIRFPRQGEMTFETNSIPRAIKGTRFFGPRLGRKVVVMRCRVVNRLFAGEEGQLSELLKTLDHNVTVVDPRIAEEEFKQEFAGVKLQEDFERVAKASLEKKIQSKEDVPLVEDFPLAFEEETSDFRDLATFLQLRLARALEHWNGNTHLTLPAIIVRNIKRNMRTLGGR